MATNTLFGTQIRKRPTLTDPDVEAEAVKRLAAAVRSIGKDYEDVEDADLEDVIHSDDGYQAARSLELDGWDPDAELVEVLDGASHFLYEAHAQAVREWVKAEGIVSRLALDTPVTIKVWNGKDYVYAEGSITRIEADVARYVVTCPSLGHVRRGLGTHGVYKDFEEVEDAVAIDDRSGTTRGS